MTTKAGADEQALSDIFYEEPEPPVDGLRQGIIIVELMFVLVNWFKGKKVFVGSKGFVFWNRLNGNERVSPDGFITLDIDSDFVYQFPNYWMWEIGKPPDVVIEVASPSTVSDDLGGKRDLYARLGISEYWKFDPLGGELYGVALMGERLVDGEYVAYELNMGADGSVWSRSEALELDFYWDGERFDIRDPLTGQTINPYIIAKRARQARLELEARRSSMTEEGRG